MAENATKRKFKSEVQHFLTGVSDKTMVESYEKFVEFLLTYKGLISTDDISSVFSEVANENELTDAQDEILMDTSNRLFGHCPPWRKIDW